MKITRPRLIGGGIAATIAAVLLPVAAAVAYISPPLVLLAEPQSPAHMVARGAALDVTIEYSCTATEGMYIDIQATERVGKRLAQGYGYAQVPCDGATHVTVVRLYASGTAFTKGRAAVQVNMSGCYFDGNDYFCGYDTINRTIRIRR